MVNMKENTQQTSLLEKWLIWILIGFWLLVMFWVLLLLTGYLISWYFNLDSWFPPKTTEFITVTILSFLFEILIIYIISLKTKKLWVYKLKKYLKICLAFWMFLILISVFFLISILYNMFQMYMDRPIVRDYDKSNPKCYEECEKECRRLYDRRALMPYQYANCNNKCVSICIEPNWKNCIQNCIMPDMWEELNMKYNSTNYGEWVSEKYREIRWANPWGGKTLLTNELHYDEWLDDIFDWHQEEIKLYESCIQSCGSDPEYLKIYWLN